VYRRAMSYAKWAAVDQLIRSLGAIRCAADAADGPREARARVEAAIRNAAEAIDLTIPRPQSRQGLSAAGHALKAARRALAELVTAAPLSAEAAPAGTERRSMGAGAGGPLFGIIRERPATNCLGPRTMVVAAHPDDETACAGALLLRLREVLIVELTDGAPRDVCFHRRAGVASRAAYADLRRCELRSALAVAGIGESRVIALGAVDQEAMDDLPRLTRDLLRLLWAWRPDVVLTHAYEGRHPDHDAAAFVVQTAVQLARIEEGPMVVEMGSYHDDGAGLACAFLSRAAASETTLVLTPEEQRDKTSMLECFASQGDVRGRFGVEEERYRPSPRYDFCTPPRPGQLHYERWGWRATGETFRVRAADALQALGTAEAARA
jgi:LmbE family N-acetylglucosaminyl deacetylase